VLAFASYALPPLGLRLLSHVRDRLSVEDLVLGAFRLCAQHPELIPADVVAEHVRLERERGRSRENDTAYVLAARSIVGALAHRAELGRLIDAVAAPTLVIHGDADRLVRVDAARRAKRRRPDWDLRVQADVGHIPMLEVPHPFLDILDPWLQARGLDAARVRGPAEAASPGI
jgi:pimeloyl-ACP methyl ester carboxylesterase